MDKSVTVSEVKFVTAYEVINTFILAAMFLMATDAARMTSTGSR